MNIQQQPSSLNSQPDLAKAPLGAAPFLRHINGAHSGATQAQPPWHSQIHALPFSLLACDAQGVILSANAAALLMLGYSQGELVGTSMMTLHEPEQVGRRRMELSGAEPMADFDAVIAFDNQAPGSFHRWSYLRKDGARLEINLSIAVRRDECGAVKGYLMLAGMSAAAAGESSLLTLAHYDALTGLPNRALLLDRVEVALHRAQRHGGKVAVMMLDLNRFKSINDIFGHIIGDALLIAVGKRLQGCLRKADTVARLGGDEFVMLFPDVRDRSELEPLMQTVIESVSAPILLGEHEVIVTPSVGGSLYPDDGTDERTLMKCADTAMYFAKAGELSTVKWYAREMLGQTPEAKSMTAMMRSSMTNDELVS